MLRRHNKSQGQALVEFALIITVLLMIIFLIIESARILQGWVTVQNAARNGARYAITGQNMNPCPTTNLPKYVDRCDDLRVASVITITHQALAGLRLDEDPNSNAFRDIDGNPPDEYSYLIEVYGGYVDENGAQLREDFAGAPGQPVIVRAVYNVPIITPFLRPIIESIPVFGQVTMNNENFGSLGNPSQGLGLPPELGTVPTVGATPTPSATPTATNTPEHVNPPTETPTQTPTATPTQDYCGALFASPPVDGQSVVRILGEAVGETVTIIDQTTGQTLGSDTFDTVAGQECPGLADFQGNPLITPLVSGHVVLAIPAHGDIAAAIVLAGSPTATATPTNVVFPTSTPSSTPTTTPTSTPSGPYITLIANCSISTQAQFNVLGFNWPTNESIALSWDGVPQSIVPSGHPGSFSQTWTKSNLIVGTITNPTVYQVKAQSNSAVATANFLVPCDNIPAPTSQPTVTSTPNPADLIVVGAPALISTPPLVAYQPIQMRVVISNTGELDVSSLFFVDIYFDPTGPVSPTIGITQSVGYMAVGSLNGGASRVITITAPLGFKNEPDPHLAYSMVDSLEDVSESDETNNVSIPLTVFDVTPAPTPTASPTPPVGADSITGIVRSRITVSWVPINRAQVTLVDSGGNPIAVTQTDRTGYYIFPNVPVDTYTVRSCSVVDNIEFSGLRTGITQPDYPFVNIYMLPGPCS